MAKFCSEGCFDICDFCKHYVDDYKDIVGRFAGSGVCNINNSQTLI